MSSEAVQALVIEANRAQELETLKNAEREAKMRQAIANAQPDLPARPAWLQAAEALSGALMSPEMVKASEEAAQRAEVDARRVDAERRQLRVDAACAGLPALYSFALHHMALARFVAREEAIAETERAFAKSAPALVWVGLSGSGKTTLACAAARHWAAQAGGGRIVFARASELATASRYHALGEGQPERIKAAIGADLLILDELGEPLRAAQWSDVEDVVFARYEQNRPTWVTTWLSPDGIKTHYGDGFARRILQRATVIDCGGT